jgi:hypothetical protein
MRPLSYHQNGVPTPDTGNWRRSHMELGQQQQGLCVHGNLAVTLHYVTFHGSKVSQNDCRMWNKSYNYKNTYTVQLKHSIRTYAHI